MNLNNKLESKLDEIADFLLNHEDYNPEIGALTGLSGNALFHFYFGNYKNDDRHIEKGVDIIIELFNRIEKGYNFPTFCDGIAGACWVLELLKEQGKIELEEDIITEEVDEYLLSEMNDFITDNNFDFMHGAIGIGLYYLKRYQNVTFSKLKFRYERYLFVLLEAISAKAIKSGDTIHWESNIISGDYNAEGCNLGLAHGIPSIVVFLSKLGVYPTFSGITTKLIKPACNYILNNKINNSKLSSSFPNWIIKNEINKSNSRLAWCYGDLGVAISILKASQTLKDDNLLNESIKILKKTTKRKDIKESGVKDAGLCHGAFGIMIIYKHFFDQTNILLFKEMSDYWANLSINLATHNDGYAGFKEYNVTLWKSNQKLLGGVSGIGLAILDYLGESIKWKEVLIID
ncbi:lanthionine synthetase C family protein [uncultured Dokdonia sp.]|uniref:lanthionine synthetase C family protein n=1 Tax=uncultured Dokdonia sp. TaxID=575653 RepID=UPI00260F34C5|nr:lanthionine synthetase C family protein [uncultured Dokdonia sp.]